MSPSEHTDRTPDVAQISSRIVYRNAWMSVREDDVRRTDNSVGLFGVVDRSPGVVVIPRRTHRSHTDEIFLVEQFRYPVGARRWEFPAGTAPDGEVSDPIGLAARELREETGLVAGRLTHLTTIDVAPGFTSQRSAVVLAEELQESSPQREHEEQDMRGRWWTVTCIADAIVDGRICDAQTLAAWACVINRDRSLRSGPPPA